MEIDWDAEDAKYQKKREKKFREVVMRLNTTHYIDRPFTVQVGKLASWLEFRVSGNPDAKPNQEILSQMLFSKNISQIDNNFNFSEFENIDDYDNENGLNQIATQGELTQLESERGALIAKNLNKQKFKKIDSQRPSS